MDAAGWTSVDEVLRVIGFDRERLVQVVRDNTKQRLQLDGDRIRACQGHSTDNPFVRVDALEKSWRRYDADEKFFHGTRADLVPVIRRDGLKPMGRTHVHCAASPDSRVGKRASVDVLLVIEPTLVRAEDLDIFVSPNGVILVRRVPPSAIVDVLPRPAMLSRSR